MIAAPTSGAIIEGNVGIGTTTVGSRVVIQGSDTTSGNSALNVLDSAGSSKMIILNNGNVGIGTTSPVAKLDVYGTAGANNIVNFASSSNVSQFLIGPNGSTTIASLGTGLVRSSSGSCTLTLPLT